MSLLVLLLVVALLSRVVGALSPLLAILALLSGNFLLAALFALIAVVR